MLCLSLVTGRRGRVVWSSTSTSTLARSLACRIDRWETFTYHYREQASAFTSRTEQEDTSGKLISLTEQPIRPPLGA